MNTVCRIPRNTAFCTLLWGLTVLAGEPKTGGLLRVPLSNDITSLDPARCYNLPGVYFTRVLYQSLVDYGDGAEILPGLAKSWTLSSNGLQYTFELDPRARFSNGRPVVASDYVFSLERLLMPKTRCPAAFLYLGIRGAGEYREGKAAHISGVEALGPDRLLLALDKPDATFLYRLAMPLAGPVCRDELKDVYEDVGVRSVGAGPYKVARWIRGAEVRLVRNPFYGGGFPAYLDEIDATVGIEQTVAEMMFERGEMDIADLNFGVAGPEFPRILRTPALANNLDGEPSSQIQYIALNAEIPPLNNKLVRQAMNYAVNKERLIQIQGGRAVVVSGVLPPVMPGYQRDLKGYEYSPEKAKRLLAEAGYADGFTTTATFNNALQENFQIVAAIQEDLRQVGIKLEAAPLSFAAYLDKTGTRKAVPTSLQAWAQDFPDPSNYLGTILYGENITDRDCENRSFYKNPQFDALIEKAERCRDPKERLRLYQESEKIAVEDAPWVFLFAMKQYCLHQPWVKNTKPHIVIPVRFEKMWMDR